MGLERSGERGVGSADRGECGDRERGESATMRADCCERGVCTVGGHAGGLGSDAVESAQRELALMFPYCEERPL